MLDAQHLSGLSDKRHWTARLTIAFGLMALLGLAGPNPLLTAAGLALPPILFALLWRPGEPPVLLFAASFQWLQVFAVILEANRAGEVIGEVGAQEDLRAAATLGLLSVLVLAIGMRIGVRNHPTADFSTLHAASAMLTPRRLARGYVVAFLIGYAAVRLGFLLPGGRQQLLALAVLRWAVSFLIGWAALRNRRFRPLAAIILVAEITFGFAGYFSGFKSILFLAIVLIASAGVRVRQLFRPSLVLILILTVALASFWQVVKDDYRQFLNQGTGGQFVLVPVSERFEYLFDRASSVTFDDFLFGLESGLDRIGYLQYFARVIHLVPNAIPHQRGRLWLEAIRHVLMPRFFFPGKPEVNDSERTSEFTGSYVAGAGEGTSISIGYAGESYIDFGPTGMFVPIFLVGCFWGWAYRWLATRTRHRLLGIAISTNLILGNALHFEASNIKLLGGAVSSLVVLWLILKFGGDRIWRYLAEPQTEPVRMPLPAGDAATLQVGK